MSKRKTLPLQGIVDRFCLFLKDKGHNPLTIKNYRIDVEGFVRALESDKGQEFASGKLTPSDLQTYRDFLVARKYSPATISRKLASLTSFLRWAAPALVNDAKRLRGADKPRGERHIRWLDAREQEQLVEAAESAGNPQHIAVIALLLSTGLRVSELCALKWNSVVSVDRSTAVLEIEDSAKEGKRRRITLSSAAFRVLKNLGFPRGVRKKLPLITGGKGPVTRRSIEVLVERYARAAGLDNVTPHVLRHTFCRNLALSNITPEVLAELAGHNSLGITKQYYDCREGADRLEIVDDTFDDAPGLNHLGLSKSLGVTERSGLKRDFDVRAIVLRMAQGHCEKCGAPEKFPGFLEVHHVLKTPAPDCVSNCVVLCPACNLEAHAAPNREEINWELAIKCARRKP